MALGRSRSPASQRTAQTYPTKPGASPSCPFTPWQPLPTFCLSALASGSFYPYGQVVRGPRTVPGRPVGTSVRTSSPRLLPMATPCWSTVGHTFNPSIYPSLPFRHGPRLHSRQPASPSSPTSWSWRRRKAVILRAIWLKAAKARSATSLSSAVRGIAHPHELRKVSSERRIAPCPIPYRGPLPGATDR